MSDDLKMALFVTLICVVVLIAFGGALAWGKSIECEAKWQDSGMAHKWALFAGCRIQIKDGTWIPSDRYRAWDEQ